MDKKKLYLDIEFHLLNDDVPSAYLNDLLQKGLLDQYPFTMLSDLKNIGQNSKYHPEGSVWNHTMLVLNQAAKRKRKSKNPKAFIWAALLHDIGKAPTTRVRLGKITSYNHERVGKKMTEQFLKEFECDDRFIYEVSSLVRWHMEPLFVQKGLPFSNIRKMLAETSLDEIVLLSLCDRFGRGDMSYKKMEDEEKGIEKFKEKCKEVMNNSKV